jgi:hypothetical protein
MPLMGVITPLMALALLVSAEQRDEAAAPERLNLATLVDRYCLSADGDHEWTWAMAAHDGFAPMSPEEFDDLRLPGTRDLRGYRKSVAGAEVRILTASNRITNASLGVTHFNLCWVAANPASRPEVDRDLSSLLHVGRFHQQDAFVYPWIPQPNDGREPVSRRDFNRGSIRLAREQGMRMVLSSALASQVSVTYMVPVQN